MLLHGASDLDQRCLKTRNSGHGCTFPPNIFAPTPKSPIKSFLGIFECKTVRKSYVNGATKLKLCSYIGIGKCLGCVKIFPLEGVQGIRAP